jgi:hypothetical protein
MKVFVDSMVDLRGTFWMNEWMVFCLLSRGRMSFIVVVPHLTGDVGFDSYFEDEELLV